MMTMIMMINFALIPKQIALEIYPNHTPIDTGKFINSVEACLLSSNTV